MPKNKVSTPITDKEVKFCHLVLSGEMTDAAAAVAAGLKASSADYIKAKPAVKAYMASYREMVQKAVAKHEAAKLIQFNVTREQAMQRLWEIAQLGPENTNGSMNSQVLALRELFDRMAWKHNPDMSDSAPREPTIYPAAWLREQDNNLQ